MFGVRPVSIFSIPSEWAFFRDLACTHNVKVAHLWALCSSLSIRYNYALLYIGKIPNFVFQLLHLETFWDIAFHDSQRSSKILPKSEGYYIYLFLPFSQWPRVIRQFRPFFVWPPVMWDEQKSTNRYKSWHLEK